MFTPIVQLKQGLERRYRRTKWFMVAYALLVPVYLLVGTVMFMAIEGDADDRLLAAFTNRCQPTVANATDRIQQCASVTECRKLAVRQISKVRECMVEADRGYFVHEPMSRWSAALMYAFGVITTIGWGDSLTRTRLGTIECTNDSIIQVKLSRSPTASSASRSTRPFWPT